jgi:hypothetical protein
LESLCCQLSQVRLVQQLIALVGDKQCKRALFEQVLFELLKIREKTGDIQTCRQQMDE